MYIDRYATFSHAHMRLNITSIIDYLHIFVKKCGNLFLSA